MKMLVGVEIKLHVFLTSALHGGEWSVSFMAVAGIHSLWTLPVHIVSTQTMSH